MGVEARYQAIPEDCKLLARARKDSEIAELMQFFNSFAEGRWEGSETPAQVFVADSVKELIRERPGLAQRYVYAGGRRWDMIIYLLSPARRVGEHESDHSLIFKSIWGSERLHPEARATQGVPIGFVPAQDVRAISDFLDTVTYELLHEHYDPFQMREMAVYKIHPMADETNFQYIWEEFTEMRDLYRAAADHNEAVITVID